ncbi:SDR family oxidoreductase [Arsenicitalea aurantiaca]|uniref:SDR family oxidoreductase n=1 Tax=Arsenicitalea aurantiaca TaxID=1783274 RepID=A0A433XBH7_9HYPH|nr:SDR family oxidoreductase [Arsenicitalea aurantiaca]RUT31380.1 SDR family oxidoreductase [Arsenicitalea aurantiaca]
MAQSIAGKTAIITGASSGIGRAAARRLAAEGVRVALVARSAEKLEALRAEIGDGAVAIPADLAVPADVDRMVTEASAALGRIDILFANAGAYISGDVAEGDPDQWDQLLLVNVNSVFRAVGRVLPAMIAQGGGDIIVTSSVSGHQAIQWEPVYSASKHAIQSFVHGVRRQAGPHNVRVGALAPGVVLNELWGLVDEQVIAERAGRREGLLCEDVADALVFMLTRPANATVRDLVLLPSNQDI